MERYIFPGRRALVHWLDTLNNSLNLCLNPHRNAWRYVQEKWNPWLHSCHSKACYSNRCAVKCDKSIQLPPENNTASGENQHLLRPTLCYSQRIISEKLSDTNFHPGRGWGLAFVFTFLKRIGYRKQPDAVHQRRRLVNRLPHLSNRRSSEGGGIGA